ncbi:tail spike protein [Klebsiella phage KMI1]|uniref:Probable tail spike protein n=1 Tax=Klebsiella phage KMI1 TaxID=2589653 RepID=A0A514U6F6_9CAUD|nr:tail spike protein [Klebsiella phage KMI1]
MDQEIKTVIQYPVGATEFDIPFDYLSRKFVRVSLVADENRRLLNNITEYRYVSKTRVRLLVDTTGFDRVEIRRFTSASERVVDFSDGSVLRAVDLNVSQLQSAHIAEEARDAALLAMPEDDAGNLDARNRKIVRLAPGELGTDAVNKNQLDTTLGEAGGYLADMKELDKIIRDFIENFANDPASLRGVVWVYNAGSAIGGETSVEITKPGDVLAVPCLYINGSRQDVGVTYDYDNRTKTITFKGDRALKQNDLLIAITAEGSIPLADILMSLDGAKYVMTSQGVSVEAAIRGIRGNVKSLLDLYQAEDGDDYSPAATRALAQGNALYIPVGRWTFKSTVQIPAGTTIFGSGDKSIIASPEASDAAGSALVTVLRADNVGHISLKDFKVDGGSGAAHTVKKNVRGVRFYKCNNIRVDGVEVSRTADWATSFEQCTEVYVDGYKHRRSESPLHGGRDGLHFLDCNGFMATNLDIESHDDCVGITSETLGTFDGHIDGVRGTSTIGSLVIYNEETSGGVYIPMPMRGLRIDNVFPKEGRTARQLVRVAAYADTSDARDVIISNVQGNVTASHGVHVLNVKNVFLDNVDAHVVSSSSHGVYINGCDVVRGNVSGTTSASTHDGVQVFNSKNVELDITSRGSAGNAAQINGCTNVRVVPLFSSAGAAGLRITGSTNVDVPSGTFSGTFPGLCINQTGNTNLFIAATILYDTASGRINSPVASMFMDIPAVIISAKEAADGTLTVYRAIGGTITRLATGRYQITFTNPMQTAQFTFTMTAAHPGSVRQAYAASAIGTSGLTLGVKDSAGTDTYSEYIRFIAYNY